MTQDSIVEVDAEDELPRLWPNLALIVGGLLMVPMWVRYMTLHGPTTFDEGGQWLGQARASGAA